MDAHDRATSEADEMYLITIARAVEDGMGPPVALSTVAKVLDVSSVSANQMVKKLAGRGLLTYTPYKGVELTEAGERLADAVLRSRRLWSVFLVDHLGLSASDADDVACEMEHVTPAAVADRLSSFLGDPVLGPQGKAIPHGEHRLVEPRQVLTDLVGGSRASVLAIAGAHAGFLAAQGIGAGDTIDVLASAPDGSMLVRGSGDAVHLAPEVAGSITVSF
jgi:DtxR family Mn-dependent transcriptional regulator